MSSPLEIVEKLPAWIHALTLLLASLYGLLTVLAHLPLPKKAKLVAMRFGAWAGDLLTELRKIDSDDKKTSEQGDAASRSAPAESADSATEAEDVDKP